MAPVVIRGLGGLEFCWGVQEGCMEEALQLVLGWAGCSADEEGGEWCSQADWPAWGLDLPRAWGGAHRSGAARALEDNSVLLKTFLKIVVKYT